MQRKKVVYVSSTFVDLQDHRAALKEALEMAGYNVECMEKYPAFEERPLDRCLADVEKADVFVLLLAHRYGYRPKQNNPENKSITQLEYEHAGTTGRPRLVFTVDPNHPWSPRWMDEGDDRQAVKTFRAQVEERHGVRRFTAPDQLAKLVQAALTREGKSFYEEIKEKAIAEAKRSPKSEIAQAMLRIRDALVQCQAAYEEYQREPGFTNNYYEAIGQLIRSLYLVRHILPILDSKLAMTISNYTGDEVDYYIYPLVTEGLQEYRKLQKRRVSPKTSNKEFYEIQRRIRGISQTEHSTPSRYIRFQELSKQDQELFKSIALYFGATGESPGFQKVISELDEFIRRTFPIEDMWTAAQQANSADG